MDGWRRMFDHRLARVQWTVWKSIYPEEAGDEDGARSRTRIESIDYGRSCRARVAIAVAVAAATALRLFSWCPLA